MQGEPVLAQVEVYLEEMLLLCQRSEEYNGFMLARLEPSPGSQPAAAASPRVCGPCMRSCS
jgi:hypothetical protein